MECSRRSCGYYFYIRSLQFIEPSYIQVAYSLDPVTAVILGYFIFHQTMNLMQILGILLILSVVGYVQFKENKKWLVLVEALRGILFERPPHVWGHPSETIGNHSQHNNIILLRDNLQDCGPHPIGNTMNVFWIPYDDRCDNPVAFRQPDEIQQLPVLDKSAQADPASCKPLSASWEHEIGRRESTVYIDRQ